MPPRNGPVKVPPGRLLALRTLLAVALACSAYLAYLWLTGGKAVGCGPDSGCDKVLASRWAYWFGIPVSAFALVVDGAFLAATFRLNQSTILHQRRAWMVVVPCALLVAGAAVWFIVIQLAVLRSICPYCMTAHGCGLVAALLALFSAPNRPISVKPWELDTTVFLATATFRKVTIAAVLGLAGLVVGQLVHQPPTFVVQQIPDAPPATNPPPAAAGTTSVVALPPPAPLPATPPATPPPVPVKSAAQPVQRPTVQRLFPVYNGQLEIDVANVPTIGAPTNAQVMVSLHDYTCHHCRIMHPLLVEAQRTFNHELVVVTLPMPFDPNCNPLMQRPNPKHTNACEYARLSLAVWRADRTKHQAYDDYLFTGENPPPVPDARQAAIELVGVIALDAALADPSVDQHLRLGIGLYEIAYRAQQGSMPQFIIGKNVAVGTLPMADLMKLLAENLGLKAPPSSAPTP